MPTLEREFDRLNGEDYSQPSDVALERLKKRIEVDATLDAEVREAILTDLASDSPAAFASLKKLLSGKVQDNEADEPQGE